MCHAAIIEEVDSKKLFGTKKEGLCQRFTFFSG
jgi:hypothetical protein